MQCYVNTTCYKFCRMLKITDSRTVMLSLCTHFLVLQGACTMCACVAGCLYNVRLCCRVPVQCALVFQGACTMCSCVAGRLYNVCLCCRVSVQCALVLQGACTMCACVSGCLYNVQLCCRVPVQCALVLQGACTMCACVAGCLYNVRLCLSHTYVLLKCINKVLELNSVLVDRTIRG